jgi:hypothetical protein
MAAVSIQTLSAIAALNHTYASIASGDTVANDGNTILLFKNSNASARTMTIAGNQVDRPGLGTISVADMTETFTIPGSGTNGGECMIGLLPMDRFNGSTGLATLTFDSVTGLTVAAIKIRRPA